MSLFNKELDELTEADLQELITKEVIESKIIEYKSALPGSTDTDKKKFLANVSSFANASGGDILFGITENREKGIPDDLRGLDVENIDKELQRLQNLMRDGIEPNIPSAQINLRPVKLSNSKYIIIIRVRKSWLAPHRISFRGWNQFYSRNANGKYRLDVQELRYAFMLSDSIGERMKGFKEQRISDIYANELPLPFYPSPKLSLHLIPISAFQPGRSYDLDISLYDIQPIGSTSYEHRYNIDGLVTYSKFSNRTRSFSYVQFYRNGIIEAVSSQLLWAGMGEKFLLIDSIEENLIEFIPKYLDVYKKLNVDLPIFVYLTLIDVKGYIIQRDRSLSIVNPYPIDRDIIQIPELILDELEFDASEKLKPIFDALWNACGYKSCLNYDENGKYIG